MVGGRSEQAQALWYVGPGRAEIRAEQLPPLADGQMRLRAVASALSRGTERLVFAGRVPESEYKRMRAPFMDGAFPFPVKYGYAMVARIEEGRAALKGRLCFSLYPHQTVFNLPEQYIVLLPQSLPPERAVLAANMETALNAMWDAAPGPADRGALTMDFRLTSDQTRPRCGPAPAKCLPGSFRPSAGPLRWDCTSPAGSPRVSC